MPEEIPSAEHSAAGIVDLFHGIADGHSAMQGSLGKVIAPPPDIDILWNGIHLTKEQVYLNEQWLIGHRREARGHIISGTQPAGHHVHTHPIHNDYTESFIYTAPTGITANTQYRRECPVKTIGRNFSCCYLTHLSRTFWIPAACAHSP